MTALAASNVTVTINHNDRNVLGRIKMNAGVAAFGDGALTYPAGGIPVPAIGHFGMNKEITNLEILDSDDGYIYKYDQANKKLQIYTQVPAIVHEEKHTAVAKAVTLDYPAAWIINVCTTGQNEALSGRGDTLADNECKLTAAIADGVRTGITTFGATDTILVTYATQAWAELYALLVQEEAVALTTGNVNLANKMAGFGYCYDTTTGLLLPIDINDSGVATGEVGIKFDSATGQLKLHSDQNGHAAKVTYLKMPTAGTWLHDRWVLDEDPTKAGGDPYTQAFDYIFVLTKGSPKTFNPIKVKNKYFGKHTKITSTYRQKSGETIRKAMKLHPEGRLYNVWYYVAGYMKTTRDKEAYKHPAMFPEKLVEDQILSWSNPGDVILDPMIGSGTTAKMAILTERKYIGIDISEEYCRDARKRIRNIGSIDKFLK